MHDTKDSNSHPSAARVPSLVGRWMRYLVGFSVSVAVGLAPFLGKSSVPLFSPMLSLIPESLQDIALPISSASMGIVAVLVQWRGSLNFSKKRKHEWFFRTLVLCISALLFLAAIEILGVVRIEVPAVAQTVSFAIGPFHPHKPPCESLSRADCIAQKLPLNEALINSYFGEWQASFTKLLLMITYVAFMSSFGMMVGLALPAK
jgi:hypothetical protein